MKYNKIVQKKYCCVGACLEMILNRNNIKNKGQIDIACKLGLVVPGEYKTMYQNAIIGDKPTSGYGTQIHKEQYSINNYFNKNNINLIEMYFFITDIEEARKFILENLENDIMICCHCATLYNAPHADWGHMVLFEKLDGDIITILDPSEKRNEEKILLKKLIESIKVHGQNNGAGFYLIKKRK